uniref:Uncharacterized protein n=1 Tax=Cucumis melo TaxID=3656 RepID=A0A9I9E740_CUCME
MFLDSNYFPSILSPLIFSIVKVLPILNDPRQLKWQSLAIALLLIEIYCNLQLFELSIYKVQHYI